MTLRVHEWGSPQAPPVVCLHGLGGHGGRFRRLAERLGPRHRVLAFDLRGHAASPWEPPWDFDAHVHDLRQTLEGVGIERCSWIGHSFGGRLVLELAARAAATVDRAALLDPALVVPPPIALRYAEEARLDPGFASLEDALADARERNEASSAEALALLEDDLRAHLVPSPDGRLRLWRCTSAVVTSYSEMAKPPPDFALWPPSVLLVRGAASHVVPDELVSFVRDGAGDGVQIVTVPGGHSVLWDAFDATADTVQRFLA